MNSQQLLDEVLERLTNLDILFEDLASRSEFESRREIYLNYQQQIRSIKLELDKSRPIVEEQETYTNILDKI